MEDRFITIQINNSKFRSLYRNLKNTMCITCTFVLQKKITHTKNSILKRSTLLKCTAQVRDILPSERQSRNNLFLNNKQINSQ